MSVFDDEEIQQIIQDFYETMAHRQYIGSRYVPTFGRKDETSVEWDNSAPYEALTIVTYQGDSYTSRQWVPSGIAIDNELYWAHTGIFNAQVEAYRTEVSHFDDRIDENSDAIAAETAARIEADNGLADDIAAERAARIEADAEEHNERISEVARLDSGIERNTRFDRLYALQARAYSTGANRYALYPGVSDSTPNISVPESEWARPVLYWSQGNGIMSLSGRFTSLKRLTNNAVIVTGLPKPRTNFFIPNIFEYEVEGEQRTSDAIIQSDGDLVWFDSDSRTLPEDTEVRFNGSAISCARFEGEWTFPNITAEDAALAALWVKAHQGMFDYTNSLYRKNNAAESLGTDCSGLIFNAYYYTGGKMLPNFALAQAGSGTIIAAAAVGQDLDTSEARTGDVLCLFNPGTDFCHHVAMFVNDEGECWHMNTSYYGGAEKGPQPIGNPITYAKANNMRYIVRYVGAYNIE